MGPNEHSFANRVAKKVAGNQSAFQTQGNKIMQIAEILRPMIAKWLEGTRTLDGMPVQPATIRAVSLNTAQNLLKRHV